MRVSRLPLLTGAIWTAASFGLAQVLRLGTNVALARLLAPDLFGIMQIFYSLRTGVELISDVGLSQNIIYNKAGDTPDFYNTAWSLQLTRSIILWILFCAASVPIAHFYQIQILALVIPIASFSFVLSGLASNSRFLLQKRMKYRTLTAFETTVALVAGGMQVLLAYLSPTIWALVFGVLAGTATAVIGSYIVLPDVKHRFVISKLYAGQILSFGKWIFFSSVIYFLSTNFDRLYLAKLIPLNLLGIYGIARTISEVLSSLVLRLGGSVIFPFIASHSEVPRRELHLQLRSPRLVFLLLAGIGFSALAATSDLVIQLLFDKRYHAAGWMLPILVIGAWFSILANLNASILMGLGKPSYGAAANGAKFAFLLVGLTIGVTRFGVLGGVIVVAASDLCRYVPIFVGQLRERFSFGLQDLTATLIVFGLIGFFEWSRWELGYGTSFQNIPMANLGQLFAGG